MGLMDSKKKTGKYPAFDVKREPVENPIEEYDVHALVEKIHDAQEALDGRVYQFLTRVNADDRIAGNFNANEEWRCWLERDREASRLLYADKLIGFDGEAVACFEDEYAEELTDILKASDAIDKMMQPLDEYRLFKTSLFNVFNNGKNLPTHLYFDQIFERAKDYGMTVKRHSRDDVDLLVSFNPLQKINRGDMFFSYEFYMRFNDNYKKECHMFSACMMDASSAESMYAGSVVLPIHNVYAKFSKDTDAYFFDDPNSLFYQHSVKSLRKKEKDRYGIPSDYFDAYFVNPKHLVDFSEKSYQYGSSKIFIPKSQVAFGGEKVYMKRWLYAKLKRPIEAYEANLKEQKASLDAQISDAEKDGGISRKNNAPEKGSVDKPDKER